MAWNKAGYTTLGTAGDNLDITSMASSQFKQFMVHKITSGNSKLWTTFNNSTGTKYAMRFDYNGTAGTDYSTDKIAIQYNQGSDDFVVMDWCFISGNEKIGVGNVADGATTIDRQIMFFKYIPSSLTDTITRIDINNGDGTGDFAVGSNVSALGSDGVESTKVQDGAVFYETDTNKSYVLYNDTWSEL
jgi:hypothetical protein